MRTRKSTILEYFIVMKNNNAEYKYYIIRGQKRYIDRKKAELEGYTEIKRLECVPNASILWNYMKEELKSKVTYCGNKLNLSKIKEDKFLNSIDILYNKRKDVILKTL